MGRSLAITTTLSAADLRKLARREHDGRVSLRLISVAAALEGSKRHVAARQGGMDRQTLCDWIHRSTRRVSRACVIDRTATRCGG